jgi:hypothetical protein
MMNKVEEIVNSPLVLKLFTPFLTGSMARTGGGIFLFVIHRNKASVPSPHPE